MQLWRSKFDPFMRRAQRSNCSKLIVVPLSVFHRMAESVGDPKGELIFIFNPGRCGSTLLTKVIMINYNRKQEAQLSPRDRAMRRVYCKSCQLPRNSADTTYTTSPDQIYGMKLEV